MKSFIGYACREQSGIELFSNRVISSGWVNLKTYIIIHTVGRVWCRQAFNYVTAKSVLVLLCVDFVPPPPGELVNSWTRWKHNVYFQLTDRSWTVNNSLYVGISISSVIIKIWQSKDFSFARWMWFSYRFVVAFWPFWFVAVLDVIRLKDS